MLINKISIIKQYFLKINTSLDIVKYLILSLNNKVW